MKLSASYLDSITFCFLLTLLCRPSFQFASESIDVNETSCNDLIQVDNQHDSQQFKLHAEGCLDDCIISYELKTRFLSKAFVLCANISELNCGLIIKLGYSHELDSLSKILSCKHVPEKYCAPKSRDLHITFKSSISCNESKLAVLRISLKPLFFNTIDLTYSSDGCLSNLVRRNQLSSGTILSQFDPSWNMTSPFCHYELKPFLASIFVINFCIKFVEYDFVSGGAKLEIEVNKLENLKMLFDSKKPMPKGKTCQQWNQFEPVQIHLITGEDPDSKAHAFLFHFTFEIKEIGNLQYNHNKVVLGEEDDDDVEDEDDDDGGLNPYHLIAIGFGVLGLALVLYCCKQAMKRNMSENISPTRSNNTSRSDPIPGCESPPSYLDLMAVHPRYELDNAAMDNTVASTSITDQPESAEPGQVNYDLALPPSYDSLFPKGKVGK